MASAIIHICVAKKVNAYLKQKEQELFLGSIAPDISKQINESKNKSHFLSELTNIPNIDSFLNKYKNKIKTPFDYGYLIHLYTDKVWYENLDKIISKAGERLLNSDKIKNDKELFRDLIYNEYTNMNIKLIDEYNLDLSLFYEDFDIPNTSITEIPIDKLNILIDKMGIIIENSCNHKNRVFNYMTVIDFINNVSEEIIDFLKENNL